MCLVQYHLFCLLAHHRRWNWLHKWIPLQHTLMVQNLLSLLLNLPLDRNIYMWIEFSTSDKWDMH
jgi:hypothetical protein